jgi:hypothetical protein
VEQRVAEIREPAVTGAAEFRTKAAWQKAAERRRDESKKRGGW